MDAQQEIERSAEALAKEKSCNVIKALKMSLRKYQSDGRLEVAGIMNKLVERELEKTGKEGFYDRC